jgi:hypothetical protein
MAVLPEHALDLACALDLLWQSCSGDFLDVFALGVWVWGSVWGAFLGTFFSLAWHITLGSSGQVCSSALSLLNWGIYKSKYP